MCTHILEKGKASLQFLIDKLKKMYYGLDSELLILTEIVMPWFLIFKYWPIISSPPG